MASSKTWPGWPGYIFILAAPFTSAFSTSLAQQAIVEAPTASSKAEFPPELVSWKPYARNPVFTAEGPGHWDVKIRERGWLIRERDGFHLWYTGYDGTDDGIKLLGYATSPDGIHWKRSPKNPLVRDHWVEDMMVVKQGGRYYMFSESSADGHAEMLTSTNRVDWKWHGPLDVRLANGKRPAERPCGTPTVWVEDGVWYLFYERLDLGVWLAKTEDPMSRVWVSVQDEPVLVPGPDAYDKELIAVDQVWKHLGVYFAFYHGSGVEVPGKPRTWNTNIARSTDLVHWTKFPGNPLIEDNKSSGIAIPERGRFRLYTMHDQVDLFESKQ